MLHHLSDMSVVISPVRGTTEEGPSQHESFPQTVCRLVKPSLSRQWREAGANQRPKVRTLPWTDLPLTVWDVMMDDLCV